MASLTVARVRRIPVRLHVSFLLILPLFAYLMARSYFSPAGAPPTPSAWAWGLLLAVGLFGSVLLHELSHSLVALREGVAVESITLLPIGGVSSFRHPPRDSRAELLITVAGPLTNFVLGAPLVALPLLVAIPGDLGTFVSSLGALNLAIGAFNLLLPAFPMDGGRILRALLARRLGRLRATRIAAGVGRGLAVLMGLWGVLMLSSGGWLLILVAVFVYAGASMEEASVRLVETMRGYPVSDLMTPPGAGLPGSASIESGLSAMLHAPQGVLPVTGADGRPVGVVTVAALEGVAPGERATATAASVAVLDVPRLGPTDDAAEAAQTLGTGAWPAALVLGPDGALVGLVTPADILRVSGIAEARRARGRSGRGPARGT